MPLSNPLYVPGLPLASYQSGAELAVISQGGTLVKSPVGQPGSLPTVFRRMNGPGVFALNLSGVSNSSRDPRPFYDPVNNQFACIYDRVNGTSYGTGIWKFGLAIGPTLSTMTDLGSNFFDPATINAATPSAGAGGCVYAGGVYNWFLAGVDTWTGAGKPQRGQIYYLTSTTLTGSLTSVNTAISDSSGSGQWAMDVSNPVAFNGGWVMAYIQYPNPSAQSNRRVVIASASSLSGPWTSYTLTADSGPQSLSSGNDSPGLFVQANRLMLTLKFGSGVCLLYDVTGFASGSAKFIGPCGLTASYEANDGAWSITGVCQHPNGTVYGMAQNEVANCKWIPFVLNGNPLFNPFSYNQAAFKTVGSGLSGTGTVTYTPPVPSVLPEGTYMAHIFFEANEQGTFTAGQSVTCDGGTGYGNYGGLYLTVGGVYQGTQAFVYFPTPTKTITFRYNNANNLIIKLVVMGVWKVPE